MTFPTNQTEMLFTQTIHPPFDEIGFVEAHHKLVSQNAQWADVGILIDGKPGKAQECTRPCKYESKIKGWNDGRA